MRNYLKSLDRRVFTILMVVFVQLVGASMALPVLPLYARRDFNMTPEVITLLTSSFFAAQFLAGPLIGRLSDQYGRVPVLIISQIGTVMSFIALGLAQSVWVLFAARIFDGITGGNLIVAQAYITDVTPREERTQALGLIFASFGLGFILGPALGGGLAAAFGDRAPFLIASIAAALTVTLTWFTLDETLTPEQRAANRQRGSQSLQPMAVLTNFPLMIVLTITFLGQFGFGLLIATYSLFAEAVIFEGYSEQTANLGIGIILGFVGVGQLIAQFVLLKRMRERYGDSMLVVVGTALRGIAMFLIGAVTIYWFGPLFSIILAIGTGLMMPPLQSLATETVDESVRGGVLGWSQSAVSLGVIVSTAIGGTLFAAGPRIPYYLGAAMFIFLIGPGLYLVRWNRAHPADEVEPAPVPVPSAD